MKSAILFLLLLCSVKVRAQASGDLGIWYFEKKQQSVKSGDTSRSVTTSAQIDDDRGAWCFDKDLKKIKPGDTLVFTDPTEALCNGIQLYKNGTFDVWNYQLLNPTAGDSVVWTTPVSGSWTYGKDVLTLQARDTVYTAVLCSESENALYYCLTDKQQANARSYNTIFDASAYHLDFHMGAGMTVVNATTARYLGNYASFEMGAAFYFRNLALEYDLLPCNVNHTVQSFTASNGNVVGKLDHSPSYRLAVTRQCLYISYEKKYNNLWSILPGMGVSMTGLQTFDSSDSIVKHQTAGRIIEGMVGCTLRKYCEVGKSRFFIGLSGYYTSTFKTSFPELGRQGCFVSLSLGFKFRLHAEDSPLYRDLSGH